MLLMFLLTPRVMLGGLCALEPRIDAEVEVRKARCPGCLREQREQRRSGRGKLRVHKVSHSMWHIIARVQSPMNIH